MRFFVSSLLLFLLDAFPFVVSLLSDEIPRASSREIGGNSSHSNRTAVCGLSSMPTPVLAECTEPIPDDIPNHVGYWTTKSTNSSDSTAAITTTDSISFRIEQCGDRYVVSGKGNNDLYYIHDFVHVDGTLKHGVMDYSAFAFPNCQPIVASGHFDEMCMEMRLPSSSNNHDDDDDDDNHTGTIVAASRCLLDDGRTLAFSNIALGIDNVQFMTRSSSSDSTSNARSRTGSSCRCWRLLLLLWGGMTVMQCVALIILQ